MKLKLLLMSLGLLFFGNSLAMTLVGPDSLDSDLDTVNGVLEALQDGEVPKGFQDAKSAIDKSQAILNNLLTNDQIRRAIASKAHYRTLLVAKRFLNKQDQDLNGAAVLNALDGKIRAKQTTLGIASRPAKPVAPVVQGISAAEAKALRDEIARLQKNEQAVKEQIVKGSSSDRELQLEKRIKELEKAASQGKISSERENELLAKIKELEAVVAKLASGGVAPVAVGGLTSEETEKVEALGFDEKRNVRALLSSLEVIKKANLKTKEVGPAVTNLEKYSLATIRELLSNPSRDQLRLANDKIEALRVVATALQKFATEGKEMHYQAALAITLPAKSGDIFKNYNAIAAKKDPLVALMQSLELDIKNLSKDATQENMDKIFKNVKAKAVKQYYQEDVKQLVEYFAQFKKESDQKIDGAKLRALNKVTQALKENLEPAKSASSIFEYTKLFNFNQAGNAVVSRKGSVFDEYLKIIKPAAEAPQMGGGDVGQTPEAPQVPGAPLAPIAPDAPAGEAPAAPSAPGAPEAPML